MNQSFFNVVHFIIRTLLVLGLVFFLFNTAFDERFISFWSLLAVLALLFVAGAFIEIKFTPTIDFWIRFPVRLASLGFIWIVNAALWIFVDRSDTMFILLVIISWPLVGLFLEWRKERKNPQPAKNGSSSV